MRTIKTSYYLNANSKSPMKVNSSSDANKAVAQCVLHMQIDHYGAGVAEVWDDFTGELHSQIKRNRDGSITIVYKRDPRSFETKIAFSALIS